MAGGRFWTTGEEATLKRMLAQDAGYAAIAKALGRSYSSVAQRVFKVSGRERLPRLHKPGELAERVKTLCIPGVPDAAVGGILGVSRQAVYLTRKRNGVPRTCRPHAKLHRDPAKAPISTRAKFLRLYSGVGVASKEIAKGIGVSESRVAKLVRDYSLEALGAPAVNEAFAPESTIIDSRLIEAGVVALLNAEPDVEFPDQEIAMILGVNKHQVYAARKRLGIAARGQSFSKKRINLKAFK